MENLISHLLEAILCMAAFYAFYRLVLRNETCFASTRWFLLAAIPVSILIPSLHIPGPWQSPQASDIWVQNLQGVQVVDYTSSASAPRSSLSTFAWVVICVYFAGTLLAGIRLIRQLIIMRGLIRQGEGNTHTWKGITVVNTHGKFPTFAFGRYLFFDNTQGLSEREKEQILMHEFVHIHQRHTADVLFLEVVQVFLWFNPLVFLLKRALVETHEYLADAYVVNHTNGAQAYGSLLARQVLRQMDLDLASHFNKAQVFRRLEMLKLKSYETSRRRFRLLVPLMMVLLGVFSCEKAEDWFPEPINNSLTIKEHEAFDHLDIYILEDHMVPEGGEFVEIYDHSLIAKVGDLGVRIEGIDNNVERQKALDFLSDLKSEVEVIANRLPSDPIRSQNLDQTPEFDGGVEGLNDILSQTIVYPTEAANADIEGKIFVSFVVGSQGKIKDIEIAKTIESIENREAIQAMEWEAMRGISATANMWSPGLKDGKAVATKLIVPITFSPSR